MVWKVPSWGVLEFFIVEYLIYSRTHKSDDQWVPKVGGSNELFALWGQCVCLVHKKSKIYLILYGTGGRITISMWLFKISEFCMLCTYRMYNEQTFGCGSIFLLFFV